MKENLLLMIIYIILINYFNKIKRKNKLFIKLYYFS